MDKKELRQRNKLLRKALQGEERLLAESKIQENLFSLSFMNDKNDYFVYLSFGDEASTDGIMDRLKDKNVYVPKIIGDDMIAVLYGGETAINSYGIKEPIKEIEAKSLDVCIAPLLAIDKNGNRIGYGKGYYDKFLRNKQIIKVAICFDFQVIDCIEKDEFDVAMDYIVTPTKIIKVK